MNAHERRLFSVIPVAIVELILTPQKPQVHKMTDYSSANQSQTLPDTIRPKILGYFSLNAPIWLRGSASEPTVTQALPEDMTIVRKWRPSVHEAEPPKQCDPRREPGIERFRGAGGTPAHRSHFCWSKALGAFSFVVCLLLATSFAGAQSSTVERPTAPKLFTEKTLAYLRVDDTRELKAKLAETSTGKLATDPQVSPLLKEFYGAFNTGLQGLQKEFGIDLNEMLGIPNGELAIALLPGTPNPFPVVLVEAGQEIPTLELLVDRAEKQMQSRGGNREVKQVGKIDVVQWQSPSRPERQFGYFVDAGVLVFSLNASYTETLAKIWTNNGVDHVPLSDNRKFTSILSQCVGADGERPQISFYVDPLAIAKELTKSSMAATATMAMLPVLGLDGIQAVGGSVIMAPKGFDSLIHLHLLLANPRKGFLEVLRPKSGETEPQRWVSEDVENYMTANWNAAQTIKGLKEIFETFRGPDSFNDQIIKTADKKLGIDFQKDFLDELDDRFTMSQSMLKPARVGGGTRTFAIKLKNAPQFESTTLPKIFDHLKSKDGKWESQIVGSKTVYTRPNSQKTESNIRRPQPAIVVIGDELLFGDSIETIKSAIEVSQNSDGLLSQSLEYKLVRDQMKLQLDEKQTSVVVYQQPEESMRQLYDLAADKNNIEKVREMAKGNPLFAALVQALESHQLPPFEVIAKYLSPSGAFVTEEENGLHYTAFSMQRGSRD